jgi:anaerobic selenocysteine-containing dehydrogenase
VLYNPDRVRAPLKRAGERGEGRWEEISWEEAIGTVAQGLREIRGRGKPHTVVFLRGDCRGLMDTFIARFCQAYGTPNNVRKAPPGLESQAAALHCTQGGHPSLAYDLDNTNCILSFGAPLLDAYRSPVRMLRAYGYLREGRPGPKAKIIQIEPRFSTTAAKADQWVPISPGTEGALALGIAYVLIREGLYDKSFVETHTFGFEDWRDADGKAHLGFKSLVLRECNVDEVARVTGVPVATVLRIAKEFATHKPAIALGEPTSTNAVYSLMAVHALNALVGSIDAPGGVVFPRSAPVKELPSVAVDDIARSGTARPRLDRASTRDFPLGRDVAVALPQAITDKKPYETSALFLYYTNPLFSSPEPSRFLKAFEQIPFIVSFSPFVDESTAYADLVLPDHTYLERWQDDPAPPAGPYTLLGLRQPVVTPLYNTMHTGDALIRIAREVGGPLAQAFPWESFLDVLKESMTGIYEAKRGSIVEKFTRKSWTAVLEERGWWWQPAYRTADEFWTQLQEKGGWWDPAYYFGEWDRIFQTPSGKFEFYSLTLKERLEELAKDAPDGMEQVLHGIKVAARGDRVYLPHIEPPRFIGADGEYPFHLNLVRLISLAEGRNADQPFLQELAGPHVHVRWDSWVEMNPETARDLGIADGDLVWVESSVGKIKTPVRLYAGASPHVVTLPTNFGHTAYGRWAQGIGANAMEITAADYDYLGGVSAAGATRVKVYKA